MYPFEIKTDKSGIHCKRFAEFFLLFNKEGIQRAFPEWLEVKNFSSCS